MSVRFSIPIYQIVDRDKRETARGLTAKTMEDITAKHGRQVSHGYTSYVVNQTYGVTVHSPTIAEDVWKTLQDKLAVALKALDEKIKIGKKNI